MATMVSFLSKYDCWSLDFTAPRPNQPIWHSIGLFLALSASLYIVNKVIRGVHAYALSPLRSVPGPTLNAFSDLPWIKQVFQGSSHIYVLELHRKYGPIVRIAPKIIAVSDPAQVRRIIMTEDWPKSEDVYVNFRQRHDHPTLISFTKEKDHAKRKRQLSAAFGMQSLKDMEPMMTSCADQLVQKWQEACSSGSSAAEGIVVDLERDLRASALDVIGETAFGSSFEIVKNGSHPLPDAVNGSLVAAAMIQYLPLVAWLPGFYTRHPFIIEFIGRVLKERISEGSSRKDIVDILIRMHEADPQAFSLESIEDEMVIFLIAGSETTANAEIFTLLYLLKNPEKLKHLQAELDVFANEGGLNEISKVGQRVPYLDACLQEAMRLRPGMSNGSPRNPREATTILGHPIPFGTTVMPVTAAVHLNDAVFDDADQFRPERWLTRYQGEKDGTAEAPFSSRGNWYAFSAGSRVCIAKNFALQEARITLTKVLASFSFEYIPGQDESTCSRVAQSLAAASHKVKIGLRSK